MSVWNTEQPSVLLVDRDSRKRQLRATALRTLEVEVHTATSVMDAARSLRRNSYDLVLLSGEDRSEEATVACAELRKSRPCQRIALLVGAPQYVREFSRSRPDFAAKSERPPVRTSTPNTQPTQWQVMMERLLAAR